MHFRLSEPLNAEETKIALIILEHYLYVALQDTVNEAKELEEAAKGGKISHSLCRLLHNDAQKILEYQQAMELLKNGKPINMGATYVPNVLYYEADMIGKYGWHPDRYFKLEGLA